MDQYRRNAIDVFVLAKLQQSGLPPALGADSATLLRRVLFDVTGLPPTVEEVKAFLADNSPGALAKMVDRLLASPRYCERGSRARTIRIQTPTATGTW